MAVAAISDNLKDREAATFGHARAGGMTSGGGPVVSSFARVLAARTP
jgi:hypothetical protein